ncbi:MAG TPA: hypothetical protein VK609_09510 [Mucilaginibacter sp.]|nr:hypothetical protein [Mucilaginibacter sp.]
MSDKKNIYELRSEEAQEILNRPPISLVLWGNTIIMITLIISLILANIIKLPIIEESNYVCKEAIWSIQKDQSAVTLETNFSATHLTGFRLPSVAKLYPQLQSNNNVNYLSFSIDSDKVIRGKIYLKGHVNGHLINAGSLGKMSFKNGEEAILKRLLNKIIAF